MNRRGKSKSEEEQDEFWYKLESRRNQIAIEQEIERQNEQRRRVLENSQTIKT